MSMKNNILVLIAAIIPFIVVETGIAATISGTVKLKGRPSRVKKIAITKDAEICGKGGTKFREDLIVGKNKGIKNAVITVAGLKAKPAKVEVSQDTCQFKPHVAVMYIGSEVKLYNNDGITHNFHSLPQENESLNKAQPGEVKERTLEAEALEVVEKYPDQCDIHEWMKGWFVVTDAVSGKTDENGAFKIDNVPPGKYTLELWHESQGTQTKEIEVKDGDNKVSFSMKKKVGGRAF